MHGLTKEDITQMIQAYRDGNTDANNLLFEKLYHELKRIADSYMRRERADHTLQPTALVNEAYIKLVGGAEVKWENRAHFFGIAAKAMRQILVDHARRHKAEKRGGENIRTDLESVDETMRADEKNIDLLLLDEALKKLETEDTFALKIVELKYFGGLTNEEIADLTEVSETTVKRTWKTARTWLRKEMEN